MNAQIAAAPRASRPYDEWLNRTSGSFLAARARSSHDDVALIDGSVRLSYGVLNSRVQSVASALRSRGIGVGDAVTFQLPNWWEAVVLYHAVTAIGAIANPVVPIYREHEMRFIIGQSRPKLIVVPGVFRGRDYATEMARLIDDSPAGERPQLVVARGADEGVRRAASFDGLLHEAAESPDREDDPERVCMLLYTSGTTADPKGVLHDHQALVYEARSIANLFELTNEDHVFMPSPLTHITGVLYGILMPPIVGCATVLLDVWSPAAGADLVEEHRCRFMIGATPFLDGLVGEYERRGRPSSLRVFGCGGADVPPSLIRRGREVLGACAVRMYGSSEMPTSSSGGLLDPDEITAETDGRPIGPVEHRLHAVDNTGVGELQVRGPELFRSYLDQTLNRDAFTADGFFRTGDLASIDGETGAVTIRGRKKDIIIRGGENISAKEIEDALYEHPSVGEVAVVAMPHERLGESICAFVVPSGNSTPTLEEMVGHLDSKGFARQKLPERVEIVDALPRTASGKVQKFVLRDRLAGR